MVTHNPRLSSAEISVLWTIYIQSTLEVQIIRYFSAHVKDEDIIPLLNELNSLSRDRIQKIARIFQEEHFPIPAGFTDEDADPAAPALFYDTFALSLVYMLARLNMIAHAFMLANTARADIQELLKGCLTESRDMYCTATQLMLSKGLYDRPPAIVYPEKIEYVEKESYLSGLLGHKRPLNVVELGEIFFNIERNSFGVQLCLALVQVVKDDEIKKYLREGKALCEEQVDRFNNTLRNEEYLGAVPTRMEITGSTFSPFSDKLIVSLFHFLNAMDLTLLGHALSMSMRVDLVKSYSEFMVKVMAYTKDGFDILVKHQWLEEPPQSVDRVALTK